MATIGGIIGIQDYTTFSGAQVLSVQDVAAGSKASKAAAKLGASRACSACSMERFCEFGCLKFMVS